MNTDSRGLTVERLRKILRYDPVSGKFRYRRKFAYYPRKEGWQRGPKYRQGQMTYYRFKIDGKSYYAHVLAWVLMKGKWPTYEVDHRDRDGRHNKWKNLRKASTTQNRRNRSISCNNPSGYNGIRKLPSGNFNAIIRYHKKNIYIGTYPTIEQAVEARCEKGKRERAIWTVCTK
jgi:hypothetical protein